MSGLEPNDLTTLKLDVDRFYRINRRIFNLAMLGFKESFNNDKTLSSYFLRILIECNKVINEVREVKMKKVRRLGYDR
ncbi:MAG: hypothetical protein QXK12_01210 [Candidatus Nezhaarchaeales archaeon]